MRHMAARGDFAFGLFNECEVALLFCHVMFNGIRRRLTNVHGQVIRDILA